MTAGVICYGRYLLFICIYYAKFRHIFAAASALTDIFADKADPFDKNPQARKGEKPCRQDNGSRDRRIRYIDGGCVVPVDAPAHKLWPRALFHHNQKPIYRRRVCPTKHGARAALRVCRIPKRQGAKVAEKNYFLGIRRLRVFAHLFLPRHAVGKRARDARRHSSAGLDRRPDRRGIMQNKEKALGNGKRIRENGSKTLPSRFLFSYKPKAVAKPRNMWYNKTIYCASQRALLDAAVYKTLTISM